MERWCLCRFNRRQSLRVKETSWPETLSLVSEKVVASFFHTYWFETPPTQSILCCTINSVGQGIHTDGHHRAMIGCLGRDNVAEESAKNSFFRDLAGTKPLCKPTVLNEGSVVFFRGKNSIHMWSYSNQWSRFIGKIRCAMLKVLMPYCLLSPLLSYKDDSLYHYVSTASPKDPSSEMRRSMLLIHSPADNCLTGKPLEGNVLTSSKRNTNLRLSDGKGAPNNKKNRTSLLTKPDHDHWSFWGVTVR